MSLVESRVYLMTQRTTLAGGIILTCVPRHIWTVLDVGRRGDSAGACVSAVHVVGVDSSLGGESVHCLTRINSDDSLLYCPEQGIQALRF